MASSFPSRTSTLAPPSRNRAIFWIVGVALATLVALVSFSPLSSDQSISIMSVGAVFFVILWFAVSTAGTPQLRSRNLLFALWWALMVSESIFSYWTEDAEGKGFSSGAYSEAMMWVFVGLGLILYTCRHTQYLRTLFTGSYKWVSWFGVMCLLSCAYAEVRIFSLAWIIKLFLAIALLAACNFEIEGIDGLRTFLKVTQWALLFMIGLPFLRLLADSATLATGRLYDVATAPTVLSVDAGLVVLLSLTLSQAGKKNTALNIFVVIGLVAMLMGGGKTGILGCIFGALAFYMLRGKFKAAARFLLIILLAGTLVVAFTPLGSYLKFYIDSGQAGSVTGRSDVWKGGWQLIKQRMILGRGFMSSRFISYKIDVDWMPNHLHNGFLEVLYNNGLIGLFVILMMLGSTVRNLFSVVRSVDPDNPLHQLAVGCLAIFFHIFVNGMVSRAFGSRPDGTFMILFALVFVSSRLLAAAKKKAEVREMPAWQAFPVPAQ